MPTNNDQVIKKRKRKPPSKTVNEFTSEDWDRYPPRKPTTFLKPGLAVRELRKDLRLMKRLAAEAMKKQPAMEGKQVQDYMLCPQTEQTQESFDADKLVLLRDLRINVGRELGYVPIALGGDGSPWLMKGKDGPPAIPEPWELRDGTGDSPMERHIAAEHEEIEWANKYLDGLFALFQEGIGSEGVCVSRIPFTRFYIYQVCPVFSRMETRISGNHYNPFYEKWYTKLSVLSVEMREFEARTKELEKEELPELIRKGKFCVQAADDIKRIRRMYKGGGKKLVEIKQQYPDMAVWNVVATLSPEDQDTFHLPGTWGPDYDKLILGKYYDGASPFTVRDWMKAYRRYEREKGKKPNR